MSTKLMIAVLVKHKSDDGLAEMNDDVPIGKQYIIDTKTIRVAQLFHLPTKTQHTKTIVSTYPSGTYLYYDLLKVIRPYFMHEDIKDYDEQ